MGLLFLTFAYTKKLKMEGGVESVYNLIPQEYHQPKKPPKYQSKFRPIVKQELKEKHTDKFHSNRHTFHPKKQFGPANVPLRGQQNFLKKSNRDLPSPKKFTYPDEDERKPAVPKNTEKPLIGVETKKDFVKTNAIEDIMSVAKRPTRKYVDSRKGTGRTMERYQNTSKNARRRWSKLRRSMMTTS